MTVRRVETPLGPVEFWGRDTGRPVQLAIPGAFAPKHYMEHNQARFPEQDVWRAHLPGNHTPALVATSIGAFAFAFSDALRQTLNGRLATVVGYSTGALVAMAMDQSLIGGLVLAEPVLRPTTAWPMLDLYRQPLAPEAADFAWQIFGIGRDRTELRDYTGLVEQLRRPARVLVGGIALGAPRQLPETPSLVDEASLELFRAHPMVSLEVLEGCGHWVLKDAQRFIAAIRSVSAA
jgi:pimeloyl-ACP methyl ester carboxylesterase